MKRLDQEIVAINDGKSAIVLICFMLTYIKALYHYKDKVERQALDFVFGNDEKKDIITVTLLFDYTPETKTFYVECQKLQENKVIFGLIIAEQSERTIVERILSIVKEEFVKYELNNYITSKENKDLFFKLIKGN